MSSNGSAWLDAIHQLMLDIGSAPQVALVALFALMGACVSTASRDSLASAGSAVAVVSGEEWVFDMDGRDTSEENLDQCLERELMADGISVVSQAQFLVAAFPELPPENAPRSPEYLKLALTHHDVRARLADLQVRYLVYVAGTREMPESWRDMTVFCEQTGTPMPACVGGIEYTQTSWLKAVLIDVEDLEIFDTLRADDTGQSWALVPVVPIPVWNIAETSDVACSALAKQVIKVITTGLAQ